MPNDDAPTISAATAFGEAGVSGLKHNGGMVTEEFLPELKGRRGVDIYRQMGDNDPVVGGVLYGIEMVLRAVGWSVQPGGESPDAMAQAEFVEQCMDDMSLTWGDFIAEALSKVQYGWAYFETVYKRREGSDGEVRSRYDDGLIGWRKFGFRAQETLHHWEIDDDGGIRGMWQNTNTQEPVFIPIEKAMLFRTTVRKNNPEGFSLLRRAYIPWYRKDRVETAELIGVERDLVGVPMFEVPEEMLHESASEGEQRAIEEYKKIVTQMRRGDQAGLVLPDWRDENGNKIGGFKLVQSPGTRTMDTSAIIERHIKWITISTLQDILILGHEHAGSLALAETKKVLAQNGMKALVDEIASTVNRHEIPRLLRLNGMATEEAPELVPGEIGERNLQEMAAVIAATAQAGMGWFPSPEGDLENNIRTTLGFDPIDPTADDGTAFEPTLPPQPDEPSTDDEPQDEDDPDVVDG